MESVQAYAAILAGNDITCKTFFTNWESKAAPNSSGRGKEICFFVGTTFVFAATRYDVYSPLSFCATMSIAQAMAFLMRRKIHEVEVTDRPGIDTVVDVDIKSFNCNQLFWIDFNDLSPHDKSNNHVFWNNTFPLIVIANRVGRNFWKFLKVQLSFGNVIFVTLC